MDDYESLPADLPRPTDDGAARHLPGAALPSLALPSTTGETVALDALGPGRTVLYVYPLSGRPGVDLPDGWNAIPGARGLDMLDPAAGGSPDRHAEEVLAWLRVSG